MITGGLVLAEEAGGKQDAKARAGVGLQHEHDGLAHLAHLGGADGREDAVVDGVVEEEDLSRLHEHREQREQAEAHEQVDACREDQEDRRHEGADGHVGKE